MDTKYFYAKDNEPVGPLTLEELLEKDINSKTYVWTKGMEKWDLLENMPEIYKALQLKKENPPRFQNEDTIEYKEEKPPHFEKEALIEQKEENPPQSKKEKRNQILNSVLLVIVLIAGLGLTAFAFFGDFYPIFFYFGYGMIGAFGYSIAEKLRLGDKYLYFIYVLFGIFFVGGIILTVGGIILTVFDWGNDLSLPNFIQYLYKLWLILVFLAIIIFITSYISDKLNLTIDELFIYGISILISLFFIGGILLDIWDWATSFRLSRNPGFVKDYEGLWGIIYESLWGRIVFGFLLIAFIITIFKTFKWFIIWISGKMNLLNKNLTKTKWFLLIGCLILGLTVVYIQIKNVKLRAENLKLEKKLSKNTPTWSYTTAVTFPNVKFIDINFRHDKTKNLIVNGVNIDNFSNVGNKVRFNIRSTTTINSVKIIDTSNVTHDIRQR